MSKYLPIMALALSFSACYTTYYTYATAHDYDENISFKILQVEEGSSIPQGNGHYRPSRGNKFVIIYASFTNKSTLKQELNFDQIYLLDTLDKTKSRVEFDFLPGPVNISGKIEASIKANDTKTRKMVFVFPKNRKAAYLLVKDKVIPIEYRD